MYWGSVKFYKHLIYITIIVVCLVIIVGISFLFKNFTHNTQQETENEIIDITTNNEAVIHFGTTNEYPYKDKYPQLYANKVEINPLDENVCYLTFNNGPSKLTTEILDILDNNDIKATFFVIINENTDYDIVNDIIKRGHSIGIYSYSNDFKTIYDNTDSFLNDLNIANDLLLEKTGYKTSIIRFPGGSLNAYNSGFNTELTSEILRRNYHYFDWNVSFNDNKQNITKQQIIDNINKGLQLYNNDKSRIVVLAHDNQGKYATVDSLEEVIKTIKDNNFTFSTLDNSVPIMSFSYDGK